MIGNFLQTRHLNREYQALCDETKITAITADPRLSEAASLLVLVRTDVSLDEASIQRMTTNLRDLADEYAVGPETLQAALHQNEPTLLEDMHYGNET